MAKLYVAYGSNLNKEQMRYRCPTAKFVGTGIIEGYELQFKGALHGACATIAPKEGAAVPVGIWTIQKPDEKRLDFYEGYHEHGHSFYDKEQIAVKMDDGSTITGMVYIQDFLKRISLQLQTICNQLSLEITHTRHSFVHTCV